MQSYYIKLDKGLKGIIKKIVPQDVGVEGIDINHALMLINLPKIIGNHPDTKQPIEIGNGRFGPYRKYNEQYINLKNYTLLTQIDIVHAVKIINMHSTNYSAINMTKRVITIEDQGSGYN